MSNIMKGLDGPMSEEIDDDEFDAMVARLKQKAAKQEKLKAQGKEPQTKQDPKTGKYYVDFDDEQVKETSSTGQGGGSAGIGGGAGLGIEKSPMEKILEKPLGEDTAYAGGGGQGGSAGQSYRKFTPKSAGMAEGSLNEDVPQSVRILTAMKNILSQYLTQKGAYGGNRLKDEMIPLLNILNSEGEKNLAMSIMQMIKAAERNDRETKGASWGVMAQGLIQHIPTLINTRLKQGVSEGSEGTDNLISSLNSWGYYTDDGRLYINDKNGDKIIRLGSNWKHLGSGEGGNGAEALGEFLSSQQGVKEGVIIGAGEEGDPMNPQVAVLGGAGSYSLKGLYKKAEREAAQLHTEIVNGHFRGSAYNIKQLANTLNTIVAAHEELEATRKRGGTKSRGIERGLDEGKLGTALGAIGLGAMMAMNPAHADVKTSDTNVSKDGQTTTTSYTTTSAINRQDPVYKAIYKALEADPKLDYNMLHSFSDLNYRNYKQTGKLLPDIEKYLKANNISFEESVEEAGQVKKTSEGWQDDERRRFKRQELQHELGREQSNNIQVKIDGRPWKVFRGRGRPDSAEEYRHLRSMKDWADKKSAATGKKWEVYLTGAPADVEENQQGLGEEQAPMFTPEAKMVNANDPNSAGWRFYKAAPAGAKESAIMKGLQTEENMNEYELGSTKKIVFSKENPPSLDYLYQQFIHRMLSSENILEPQDWIERVNKHYGLNYTWRDYQNRGRNDHTDNWQKVVKKYIVKIKESNR